MNNTSNSNLSSSLPLTPPPAVPQPSLLKTLTTPTEATLSSPPSSSSLSSVSALASNREIKSTGSSSVTSTAVDSSSSSSSSPTIPNNNSQSQPTNKVPVKKKSAQDFKFIGAIGEGSFSVVALAVDIHNKQKYAIKICEKMQLVKEKKTKAIMREKEILNLLDSHPNPYFIRLHFSFQDTSRLFFGLSFARGGELLTYIQNLSGFNKECARFYSAQILLALEYLHKLGIIHRDLKPENLLLNERLHIQITDFGSAFQGSAEAIRPYNCDSIRRKRITSSNSKERIRNGENNDKDKNGDAKGNREGEADGDEESDDEEGVLNNKDSREADHHAHSSDDSRRHQWRNRRREETNNSVEDENHRNSRSNSFVGTAQYVSPEMLKYKRSFTSSDLWAYGCIIYQMLVGSPPFSDATDFLIFQKILAVNVTFPKDMIDPVEEDLIRSLIVVDPCSRLGSSDDFTLGCYPSIRSHPFFSELSKPSRVTASSTSSTTISSQPTPLITTSKLSDLSGSSFLSQTPSTYSQTRWSTLHLERSPLLEIINKEDYDLESRISCLSYDEIEPGFHEGLLLGLGLSDNPKKSDLPFAKVDSTTTTPSSSSQRTGYNNNITSNKSEKVYNSKNDKNSSSHKENSRSNNNPKKKGLLAKLFHKH